jgi:hypothetical protein
MQSNSTLTYIALFFFILFTITLMIFSVLLYQNRTALSSYLNQNKSTDSVPSVNSLRNTLFANQTASFIGIITKVDGSLLHLENSSGETGQVKISNNFSIFDLSQKNGGAAHDMNSIRLNEKVLINLEVIDGEY